MTEKKERASMKEYFQFNELGGYFFRKKSKEKANFNIRSMHFINKFSMAVFLIAVIYLIIKNVIL